VRCRRVWGRHRGRHTRAWGRGCRGIVGMLPEAARSSWVAVLGGPQQRMLGRARTQGWLQVAARSLARSSLDRLAAGQAWEGAGSSGKVHGWRRSMVSWPQNEA
jgi:hypothetical protein